MANELGGFQFSCFNVEKLQEHTEYIHFYIFLDDLENQINL